MNFFFHAIRRLARHIAAVRRLHRRDRQPPVLPGRLPPLTESPSPPTRPAEPPPPPPPQADVWFQCYVNPTAFIAAVPPPPQPPPPPRPQALVPPPPCNRCMKRPRLVDIVFCRECWEELRSPRPASPPQGIPFPHKTEPVQFLPNPELSGKPAW